MGTFKIHDTFKIASRKYFVLQGDIKKGYIAKDDYFIFENTEYIIHGIELIYCKGPNCALCIKCQTEEELNNLSKLNWKGVELNLNKKDFTLGNNYKLSFVNLARHVDIDFGNSNSIDNFILDLKDRTDKDIQQLFLEIAQEYAGSYFVERALLYSCLRLNKEIGQKLFYRYLKNNGANTKIPELTEMALRCLEHWSDEESLKIAESYPTYEIGWLEVYKLYIIDLISNSITD